MPLSEGGRAVLLSEASTIFQSRRSCAWDSKGGAQSALHVERLVFAL
jgi:hypothetical protein